MRNLILGLLTICISGLAGAADRVGDFTLLDQNGDSHSMSWYDDQNAVVFLTQANQCSALDETATDFNAISARYEDVNFQFMMLNAEGNRDRTAVAEAAARYGTELPILMDESQMVSQAMEVSRAGEHAKRLLKIMPGHQLHIATNKDGEFVSLEYPYKGLDTARDRTQK